MTRHRRSRRGLVGRLAALALTLAGTMAAAPPLPRLVIVGDSIAAGVGASLGTRTVTYRLQSLRPDLNLLNYSRGGWTVTPRPVRNVDPSSAAVIAVPPLAPQLVLIALGTNDWAADIGRDTFEAAYRRLLATLASTHPAIYCLTPVWREHADTTAVRNRAGLLLNDYRALIARNCTAAGGTVLDGLAAIPHAAGYFTDGVHPNDRGHESLARFLARGIAASR